MPGSTEHYLAINSHIKKLNLSTEMVQIKLMNQEKNIPMWIKIKNITMWIFSEAVNFWHSEGDNSELNFGLPLSYVWIYPIAYFNMSQTKKNIIFD